MAVRAAVRLLRPRVRPRRRGERCAIPPAPTHCARRARRRASASTPSCTSTWHGDVVDVGIGLRPELTGPRARRVVPPRASSTTRRSEWRPRDLPPVRRAPGTSARSGSTSDSASARSRARRATSSSSASTSSSRWSARREGAADHRRAGGRDRRVAVRVPVRVVRHVGRPAARRAVREPGPARRTCGRSSTTTASSSASSTSSPRDDEVRLGLGMRPDLTGRGLAQPFIEAGLDYARREWQPRTFRLWVAGWNERALRAYRRAGFHEVAARRGEPLRGDGAARRDPRRRRGARGARRGRRRRRARDDARRARLPARRGRRGRARVGAAGARGGRGARDGRRARRRGARRADGGGARALRRRTRARSGRATSRPPPSRARSARRRSAARSPSRARSGSASSRPAASAASTAASPTRPTSRPISRSSRGRRRSSSRRA